jgi:hypothetical protein
MRFGDGSFKTNHMGSTFGAAMMLTLELHGCFKTIAPLHSDIYLQ